MDWVGAFLLGILLGGAALLYAMQRGRGIGVPLPEPASAAGRPQADVKHGYAMVEAVLRVFPDPVMLIDHDGIIIMANGEMTALNRSAQQGRHIGSVLRAPAVVEAIQRVLSGAPGQSVEFAIPGSFERHLEAFVIPIQWSGLERGAKEFPILLALHDLTSAMRLEQMRVDFVANASHELRTPLASMAGFIETLRGPARDDEEARDKFLKIMEEQAARMGRLINDLLSLSRIELNEHVPPGEDVYIDKVVQDVADALGPVAKDLGVELEIEGDCPVQVTGDWDELTQVIQNLVDNAIHYGASGKKVIVRIDCATIDQPGASGQDVARVSVKDFGPGIPREHIPRLTERFYRVDVSKSRRQGGTGLGLAIVKHIVMRHRGSFEIQSEKGKGSTFTVSLPRVDDDECSPPENHKITTVSIPEPPGGADPDPDTPRFPSGTGL